MSSDKPKPAPIDCGHRLLYSTVTGMMGFTGICLVVSRLGLEPLAAAVFAGLSAFTIGGFVYRERTLLGRVSAAELDLAHHQDRLQARIEHWYDQSGVALVKYDASTLIVIRMGVGCADLLGIDPERSMSGARLEDVLHVEASTLEIISERIRKGANEGHVPLLCKAQDGQEVEVHVSGVYLPDEHALEVVLICHPDSFDRHANLQETMDDLERFRKGMMRREKRILDLKSEVNQLRVDGDQPPRYEIDASTSDSKVQMMSTKSEEASE